MSAGVVEMRRVGSAWWYTHMLRSNGRLILTCAVVGAALGLGNMLRERQYVATARFRAVGSVNAQQSALSAIGAQFGFTGLAATTDAPELYVNILMSRDLLRELGSKQYTLNTPTPYQGDLYGFFEIEEGKSAAGNLKLVKALQDRIKPSVDRVTGIVTFQIRTNNPELSESIAVNALALLNEYDIRRKRTQAKAEREFVEQMLRAERATLTADENALTSFYTRNRQLLRGVGGSPVLAAEEARLQRRVQFSQQVYLALAQSLTRAELEESRNTPVIAVLQRPEGFVERRPKGTLRLMIVLAVIGAMLASAVVMFREYRSLTNEPDAA